MNYATPLIFTLCILITTHEASAQKPILDAGLRFQKTIGLYWENGISFQYSMNRFKRDRFYLGVSYVTSRLGSAINSNAISQDNYLFNISWYFGNRKKFRSLIRMNVGYFKADYEDPVFDVLDNSSLLLSPEFGFALRTNSPFKIMATVGYNLITGNGEEGAGTLYPMFVQTTLSWNLFQK